MKQFNVFSAFDGCSMAYPALLRAGIPATAIRYFASEIDKYAIAVSKARVPNVMHMGDIRLISGYNYPGLDLLIGGSPCTNLSVAGNGKGLKGTESQLFWEFVRFWKESKPRYFLLENVASMRERDRTIISEVMGVEPIKIDSALLSAQTRKRLYWTNIPNVEQPEDLFLRLVDVVKDGEVDRDKSYCLDANYFKGTTAGHYFSANRRQVVWKIPEATKKGYVECRNGDCIDLNFIRSDTRRGRLMIEKSHTVSVAGTKLCKVTNDWFRMLTPEEAEILQTLPEGWTAVDGISRTQRYKMIGNGYTVDVISHILKNMKV
jgi:DNA-cytosine methyltransferase